MLYSLCSSLCSLCKLPCFSAANVISIQICKFVYLWVRRSLAYSHLSAVSSPTASLLWEVSTCVFYLPKPARTGEQSIGTLCSRKQTSETVCDAALSECESTRPSNPRMQTSPRGESAPGSASALPS